MKCGTPVPEQRFPVVRLAVSVPPDPAQEYSVRQDGAGNIASLHRNNRMKDWVRLCFPLSMI